ncbi:MAG: NYN domain-containing protein [Candidatus Latescibacterota bacterium]
MNKPQKIIIDGYNMIHADPELKRYMENDMNRARGELIDRLKMYLSDKAVRITVVFDGQGGLTDVEMVLPAKLQVMFSPFGQTADELIVGTLQNAANPREYIIVTSDSMDIGREASSLGATVESSAAFLERIDRNPTGASQQEEKPKANEVDTEYWLRVFSGQGKNEDRSDGENSG